MLAQLPECHSSMIREAWPTFLKSMHCTTFDAGSAAEFG